MIAKRKAIFLGPAYPYRGGIAAFNQQLAEVFIQNNWDVELLSYKYLYPSILFPGKNQYLENEDAPKLDIKRSLHSLNPLNWRQQAKSIANKKPDLIIGQYWMPFVALHLASYFKKIKKWNKHLKKATIVHNLIPHEPKPGDAFLTKYMLKNADYFVSLSEAVDIDILKTNPDVNTIKLFHPIYNYFGEAIEKKESKAHLKLETDTDYLLFFGLVRSYKGLDLLLEAMACAELESKKLLVVGEFYEEEEKYRKQINRLGIEDRVVIRNEYIPDEEVKYYFSAVDCVVLPYKTATQSGITQIGLHFEKPIIATNVGGLHEVVKNGVNGNLVKPEVKEIKKAIIEFYECQLESKYSQASKELKKALSWQNFYEQLIKEIYNEE